MWVLVYLAAIGVAEALVAFISFTAGVFAHALLVAALLNHYLVATRDPGGSSSSTVRTEAAPNALLVLLLVPLLRIVSLTMAVDVSGAYQLALVGGPVLLAAVLAARFVDSTRLLERLRRVDGQAPVALAGIPLGLIAFLIARPELIENELPHVVVAIFALVVFGALTEEIVFRGLVQDALVDLFGRRGILGGSFLFAMAYIGVRPLAFALFFALVGLAFAWYVERTQSLAGVTIAHALLNLGLFLVWPWLLG